MGGDSVSSAPARTQSGRAYPSSSASVQSNRSQRSTKSSKSLQLGLEKIDRSSSKGSKKQNGSTSGSKDSRGSGRSHRSAPVISSSRSLSSRNSTSSRNSAPKSNTRIRLEQISEKSALNDPSVASESSSWRKPYEPEGSSASVSGTASVSSRRSNASSVTSATSAASKASSSKASSSGWSSSNGESTMNSSRASYSSMGGTSRSSKTTFTSNARAQDDDPSVASNRSSSSSRGTRSSASTKQSSNIGGYHLSSSDEGIHYLEDGDYSRAILLFTDVIQANKKNKGALATFYAYRSEALYEIGAYEASARDARNALECERSSRSSKEVNDHPYVRSSSSGILHPEQGAILRARALCFLGLSLLKQGDTDGDGVADALGESTQVAKRALDDAEDLSTSDRKSSDIQRAMNSAKDSMNRADEGMTLLGRYEKLKSELDSGSYNKKDYLDILDDTIAIAPAAIGHHVAKIKYLVGRRKWFVIANHCERLAADAVKRDVIYGGDLAQLDPFPGAAPPQELSLDFYTTDGSRNEIPVHLRMLSPKAARDAVFRMPERLLPYYLRALRLEERYKAAVMAGTSLAEFDAASSEQGRSNPFAENKRFHSEWDKLDRTIKIKEESDSLFRDGYHDRAVKLYGECLAVDGGDDEDGRGSSILRPASSWPVACTKPNEAGGKLHAVLHSNRAACFSAMGRDDDAIKESSHALQIHTMYVKALLRRARCYAKTGQKNKAKADFGRFVVLVDGARDFPYPPPNQGSSCYFDMPSNVTEEQLEAVRNEMKEMGIKLKDSGRGSGMAKKPSLRAKAPSFSARSRSRSPSRAEGSERSGGSKFKTPSFPSRSRSRSPSRGSERSTERSNNSSKKGGLLSMFSCCKKGAASQVEMRPSQPSNWPTGGNDGDSRSRGVGVSENGTTQPSSGRRVSFSWSTQTPAAAAQQSPQNNISNPPLIKSRPAFEHPLDPPSEIDYNVDYYAILELSPSATDSEIKQSYHTLAREYHPDRNVTKEAPTRFHDIKTAYAILGDTKGKKREYDGATTMLEP